MCLEKGTPYRLYRHRVLGEKLPPLDDENEDLIAALRAELLEGVYFNTDLFHPLLSVLLTGLATQSQKMPLYFRQHKLCEVVQGMALIFGIGNNFGTIKDFYPDPDFQTRFLFAGRERWPEVTPLVYMNARLVANHCCGPLVPELFDEEIKGMTNNYEAGTIMTERMFEMGLAGADDDDEPAQVCVDGSCAVEA